MIKEFWNFLVAHSTSTSCAFAEVINKASQKRDMQTIMSLRHFMWPRQKMISPMMKQGAERIKTVPTSMTSVLIRTQILRSQLGPPRSYSLIFLDSVEWLVLALRLRLLLLARPCHLAQRADRVSRVYLESSGKMVQ